jgi:hypothetical protein
MTDQELINQIQSLKGIKPNQNWVVSVKSQILGTSAVLKFNVFEEVIARIFQPKFAFAPVMALILLVGIGLAKNSLPGDALYSVKKATEKGESMFFVSSQDLPKYKLEMANRRLEELTKIAQINEVERLVPAISAFQSNMNEAASNLTNTQNVDIKEIVAQTKKIEENKQIVEALGIVIGETDNFDNAMKQLVEREINGLENQILNENQQNILLEIKESYEAGNYSQALEKILLINYAEQVSN